MSYPAEHPEDLITKVAAAIADRFSVPPERARRLAVAAMDSIDSYGGSPRDWPTIEKVISVVVRTWIAEDLVP
jgi:hypothetical protein